MAGTDIEGTGDGVTTVKLRSYQQEMLDASLKRNVTVAMDTGSGKTHVAIYRILSTLEQIGSSKLVWFMAPSVALCMQQFNVLHAHLPGYLIKSLTGVDGVDLWTHQTVWDAFLTNVRVVVSTPAVLADALTHGFVPITRLSLLVFDEAHRCIGNAPMNSVMRNFYHPAKGRGEVVPSVLGLTASPVFGKKKNALEELEANLDAKTISPKEHRSTLETFVHPPELTKVVYRSDPTILLSPVCDALNRAVQSYNISIDPYVLHLKGLGDEPSLRQLSKIAGNSNTYCYTELRTLQQRTDVLERQLGASGAEWYFSKCVDRFNERPSSEMILPDNTAEKENVHLKSILKAVASTAVSREQTDKKVIEISDKVRNLIEVLLSHAAPSVRGIVFVEQRATVAALAHVLRSHPSINKAYSIGGYVGTSSNSRRKDTLSGFVDLNQQEQDYIEYRNGEKNLMIATSVFEEGIDIPACNLVICFDPPKNLVSFVQGRGRARQKHSKYAIFLPEGELRADPSRWQGLEAEMKEAYMDESRIFREIEDDPAALSSRLYRVSSTDALLTLENAKAHLYHFCAVSSSHVSMHVDLRPEFDTEETGGGRWTAHVTLPAFVHPDFRRASSSQGWLGESTAIKDAAFEAYVALHKAELVNDNLLPLVKDYGPDEGETHADQPSLIEVADRHSSWTEIFKDRHYEDIIWRPSRLSLTQDAVVVFSVLIWLPTAIDLPPFKLYFNEETTYTVNMESVDRASLSGGCDELNRIRAFSRTLLESVHASRMAIGLNDFPVLFSPENTQKSFPDWRHFAGAQEASMLLQGDTNPLELGLIRANGTYGALYVFAGLASEDAMLGMENGPQVLVTKFPKRRDFLHAVIEEDSRKVAYKSRQLFPISDCTINRLPARYSLLAAFVPSIQHRLDIALLTQSLQSSILRDVNIQDTALLTQAISSPAAGEIEDYNRLEYLGDCVLKFCTVLNVMAKHTTWPEKYLILAKDRIVRNSNLAKVALEAGLDKYCLTKYFTGNKWRPVYVSELLAGSANSTRTMSSKVLADVVEALIGASFVDGGMAKSLACIRKLLPRENWQTHETSINQLVQEAAQSGRKDLGLLEELIGHQFTNQALLLEAITHVSFPNNPDSLSYERLELLGDAVLDMVIVPKLVAHPKKLKHWELHRVRQALVNGDFLGYCNLRYAIQESKFDIRARHSGGKQQFDVMPTTRSVHLHDFLRAGQQTVKVKMASIASFERWHAGIDEALERGSEYPWPDLVAMRPQKFISDMVEAILGALYLDSRGDLSVCEEFVKKLGILHFMTRFLDDNIETAFPKERMNILADRAEVKYLTKLVETPGREKLFDCKVLVGPAEVTTVTGCETREEAEVRAAQYAARVLEKRPNISAGTRKRKLEIRMSNEVMIDDGMMDMGGIEGGVSLSSSD